MALRVENLTFWQCGPINLSVNKGQCVGIFGASGSGKTLLLRALADLDPHEGNVYLNDRECRDVPPHEWRKHIGMIPAEFLWWYDTVGEHFSSIDEQWLAFLGFSRDVIDWHVNRLSMGERSRLGLLRTLANHPQALLLDEPTANLDEKNTRKVEELIKSYQQEHPIPIVWVSHSEEQQRRMSDAAFELLNGMLVP
ncbi:MAG: ATP-binding cassette domain-containing protein [Waddliaceae bacterium]